MHCHSPIEPTCPSDAIHKDTDPPSVLHDGKWADPAFESVQYSSDTTITADLGEVKAVEKVRLIAFVRASTTIDDGFNIQKAALYLSNDGNQWTEGGEISADDPQRVLTHRWGRAVQLVFPVGKKTRFVKLAVTKDPGYERMLLGEIEIVGEKKSRVETTSAPRPMPRPMHVKRILDSVLLKAGVQYLYSSYATDVLVDRSGQPCGIVMANRAGRQAVLAKTIVDATGRGQGRQNGRRRIPSLRRRRPDGQANRHRRRAGRTRGGSFDSGDRPAV